MPLAFPKPTPRCILRKRKKKLDARDERACRMIVRQRDKGKCRIPGCIARAEHLHHVTFRSQSSKRKWLPSNCASVCQDCHRLIHARIIFLSGDADNELIVTGDVNALRFRL